MLDCHTADTSVRLRMTWARANYQLSRLLRDQIFQGNLIVAENSDLSPFEDQILVNVIRERVVIVNEDDVGCAVQLRGSGRMVGEWSTRSEAPMTAILKRIVRIEVFRLC